MFSFSHKCLSCQTFYDLLPDIANHNESHCHRRDVRGNPLNECIHFQLVFISTLILTSHGYKWRDSVLIRNINANFWYTLVVKYQLLSEIQTCANYYEQCQRYFISELMICFVLSQNRIPYLYSDHELFGSFVIITWINRSYRLNNRSCVQNK